MTRFRGQVASPVTTGQLTLQSLEPTEEMDLKIAHPMWHTAATHAKLLLVSAAAAAFATTAQANTTYKYTGNPFTFGNGSVTATVTFDSTVTATHSGFVALDQITSWSIASGALSFSSLSTVDEPDTSGFIPLKFQFSSGSIVQWDFAHNPPGPEGYDVYTLRASFVVGNGTTVDESLSGYVIGNPGIWAPVPVPEPAALSLLLLGLGFVIFASKSRSG